MDSIALATVIFNMLAASINAAVYADSKQPVNLGFAVACSLLCIVAAIEGVSS